jgi:hypothetical protein
MSEGHDEPGRTPGGQGGQGGVGELLTTVMRPGHAEGCRGFGPWLYPGRRRRVCLVCDGEEREGLDHPGGYCSLLLTVPHYLSHRAWFAEQRIDVRDYDTGQPLKDGQAPMRVAQVMMWAEQLAGYAAALEQVAGDLAIVRLGGVKQPEAWEFIAIPKQAP